MADIEERMEKALAQHLAELPESVTSDFYWDQAQTEAAYRAGYMAGVAQTQGDYSRHYSRERTT